jgi:hypothetical protein
VQARANVVLSEILLVVARVKADKDDCRGPLSMIEFGAGVIRYPVDNLEPLTLKMAIGQVGTSEVGSAISG